MEVGYDGKIAVIYAVVWYLFQTKGSIAVINGTYTDEGKKIGASCWKVPLFYQLEFGLRGIIT